MSGGGARGTFDNFEGSFEYRRQSKGVVDPARLNLAVDRSVAPFTKAIVNGEEERRREKEKKKKRKKKKNQISQLADTWFKDPFYDRFLKSCIKDRLLCFYLVLI